MSQNDEVLLPTRPPLWVIALSTDRQLRLRGGDLHPQEKKKEKKRSWIVSRRSCSLKLTPECDWFLSALLFRVAAEFSQMMVDFSSRSVKR